MTRQTVTIPDDFDLDKILASGQCFRPAKQPDGWYRFISGRRVLYLLPRGGQQYETQCKAGEWEQFWRGYFDLDRSYAALRCRMEGQDPFVQSAMDYGKGIRILRQDVWEMLITFIISQRKSIPAIRTAVELLAQRYGEALPEGVCAFPTPEALCRAGEEGLQQCGLGYRTRYVLHAAQQAAAGRLDLQAMERLPDEELFAALLQLEGVGKKVANCVCLFGFGRVGRVPVDVWIQRLIQEEFGGRDPFPRFGGEAGILQQYLFYYKRSLG